MSNHEDLDAIYEVCAVLSDATDQLKHSAATDDFALLEAFFDIKKSCLDYLAAFDYYINADQASYF